MLLLIRAGVPLKCTVDLWLLLQVTETWRSPINKFFSYVASYIIFLMLLYTHNDLDNKTFHRGAPITGEITRPSTEEPPIQVR